MIDLLLNNLTSWFIGLFLSALTFLINKLVNSFTKTQKMKREQIERDTLEQSDMKVAILSILRSHINTLLLHIRKKRCMTTDEAFELEEMATAYKKLGGNGRTERLIKHTKERYEIIDAFEMYEIDEN